MKISLLFFAVFSVGTIFSQTLTPEYETEIFTRDTLITVKAKPDSGFNYEYLVFIPKATKKGKEQWLIVEPNNSGFTSDSIEKHHDSAIFVATKRSLGNYISRELKMPLLVPVFPRPKLHHKIYTHALDRDVMLGRNEDFFRPDLQLISMVEDVRTRLEELGIPVKKKLLMSGFSASGSFVNRFLFLHPEIVQATVAGGVNGILMLPRKEMNGIELNYPLGINDLEEITGKKFNSKLYSAVPQFIFMGALDGNDAVPYDDAYGDEERKVIYATVGKQMQPNRWEKCQQIYREEKINSHFRIYLGVGHRSDEKINLELIAFIKEHIYEDATK
ncbi:hypothetical protein [Salinimicrobium xinjiangense]|uniref:hypothetical protein n=1 Tax=Salinimicrobium xinjiangense TaxID=438596 RepID=UPI0003FECB90|nr:hypothetical protein [Salinimicrobium xinjiangense]